MSDKAAFKIREFCQAHGLSESIYYEMKREGLGPREMRIGSSGVRISQEAAAEWRRKMEERAAAEAAADKEAA
jgi:predicted DNA-binding transcriptional regulator AlpA